MQAFQLLGKLGLEGEGKVKAQLERVENQADDVDQRFKRLGRQIKRGIQVGVTAGATAIAGMTTSSIRQLTQFDNKIREVYTLIPDASDQMKEQLSQDVRDLGEEYGFLAGDTVPALYQAISAGVPPDNVMDFMETAAKSARAGVTTLKTSVDGLSTVVNAYGEDVVNAEQASDVMFTTVEEGKTTFDELSQFLGDVIPIAASAEVEFSNIGAALATMTSQGLNTRKSTTQLRQMLNELTKEGTDAAEAFERVSGKSFQQFIDQGGNLRETMELLDQAAENNNTSVKNLFQSVEAGQAALFLTGRGMDIFTENMDSMEERAGAVDTAYSEMSESVQQKLDELRAWWQNQRIEIGEDLEGQFRDLLKFLRNNEDELSNLIQDIFDGLITSMKWIKNNGRQVEGILQGIGAALLGWKVAALTTNLWGLAAVLGVLSGSAAFKMFNKIKKALKETREESYETREELENHKDNVDSMDKAVADLNETLEKQKDALERMKEQEGIPQSRIDKQKQMIKNTEKEIARLKNWKKEEEDAVEQTKAHVQSNENLIQTMKTLGRSEGGWIDADAEERFEQLYSRWQELLSLRETLIERGATAEELAPLTDQMESIQQQIDILGKGEDELTDYGAAADTVETKLGQLKGTTKETNEETKEFTETTAEQYAEMYRQYNKLREMDRDKSISGFMEEHFQSREEQYEEMYNQYNQLRKMDKDKSIEKWLRSQTEWLKKYKVEWEGFGRDLEQNISDTLTNMITDFENFGDHLSNFFDQLTRNIINRYTDKWAAMIVDNLPTPGGGGGSSGGGSGIDWGSLIQTGINWLAGAQEGAKITGETVIRAGEGGQDEVVTPLDRGVMKELAGRITEQMGGNGEGEGSGGIEGDVNVISVEGMSDRAFVNGVQRNSESVKAMIMDAVSNNEELRQQLRRALV